MRPRWLDWVQVGLVVVLIALVVAIAALAYVVSFEAIRAFAVETAAFPPDLAWSAPLLVDSFQTSASLVILWRYLRGDDWWAPWYAWTLVAASTGVSVALNVAHAPDVLAAQLFAALPPVALLGALELLMSVARVGLPKRAVVTGRETIIAAPSRRAPQTTPPKSPPRATPAPPAPPRGNRRTPLTVAQRAAIAELAATGMGERRIQPVLAQRGMPAGRNAIRDELAQRTNGDAPHVTVAQ